jgi:hypothetical protein
VVCNALYDNFHTCKKFTKTDQPRNDKCVKSYLMDTEIVFCELGIIRYG